MRITQLRVFSAVLMTFASLFMILSLSTVHWYSIGIKSKSSSTIVSYNFGLFSYCYNGRCYPIQSGKVWLTAVISCVIIAVTTCVITLFGFIMVFFMNKSAKIVAVGMFLVALFSGAALLIYPLSNNVSGKGSMGYSYYLGWVGMVTAAAGGVFAFAERDERVQPSFYQA